MTICLSKVFTKNITKRLDTNCIKGNIICPEKMKNTKKKYLLNDKCTDAKHEMYNKCLKVESVLWGDINYNKLNTQGVNYFKKLCGDLTEEKADLSFCKRILGVYKKATHIAYIFNRFN